MVGGCCIETIGRTQATAMTNLLLNALSLHGRRPVVGVVVGGPSHSTAKGARQKGHLRGRVIGSS